MDVLGPLIAAARTYFTAALAAVVVGSLLAAVSAFNDPETVVDQDLLDSTIWVATSAQGMVHPMDGTVGRAGPPMRVPDSVGADLKTVQFGSHGFVVNRDDGWIRFIDASTRTFGPAWTFDADGELSYFVEDEGVGWAYLGAPSHRLQRVVPGRKLERLGDAIPIVADGDDAVLDEASAILMPDQDSGDIVRVDANGAPARTEVASPGNDLVVRLVDNEPVVLDIDERSIVVLDDDLNVVRPCGLEITGAPVAMRGNGVDRRFAVLVPEQASVVVLDVDSCESRLVDVGSPGDSFGVPLFVDGALYVANYSDRNVRIVEIGSSFDSEMSTVITRPLVERESEFELMTEHGLVVFNDPMSSAAGSISRGGDVLDPGKFSLEGESSGGLSSPLGESERSVDDGVDLVCSASPSVAGIGETVEITAEVASGEEVSEFEFVISGRDGVQTSPDGSIQVEFDEPGVYVVQVRAVLADGGASGLTTCAEIQIAEASLGGDGPNSFGCQTNVGSQAMVGQTIVFTANLPDTVSSWEWEFSDGVKSADQEAQHAFSVLGGQSATITANLESGGVVTAKCQVTITQTAPGLEPDFRVEPSPPLVGEAVRVTSTTPNEEATDSYSWSFEGAEPATATGEVVDAVTWPAAGRFRVRLIVTNADGESFERVRTVQVQDEIDAEAPEVTINRIGNRSTGQSISLGFETQSGRPVSAQWEIRLTNDVLVRELQATYSDLSATHFIPEHRGGTYEVSVTVTDNEGRTDTDSSTFFAVRALNVTASASLKLAEVGDSITFTASSSNQRNPSYTWDFGDGGRGSGQQTTHVFSSLGTKRVTVTGTLDDVESRGTVDVDIRPQGSLTTVPTLVGDTEANARSELARANLEAGPVTAACAPGVPAGQVTLQGEEPGERLAVETPISFSISDGTDWDVPDIALGASPSDYGLQGRLTIEEVRRPTNDLLLDGEKTGQRPNADEVVCGAQTVMVFIGEFVEDPPETNCSPTTVDFGATVSCTVTNNPSGGTIKWGDGSRSSAPPEGTVPHNYESVGEFEVSLDYGGVDHPSAMITVRPDLNIRCVDGPTWDVYAFDGNYILDTDGNAQIVGSGTVADSCTAESSALSTFGGTVTWSVEGLDSDTGSGGYADEYRGQFQGVQPATLTMTVTVNGIPKSESKGIYYSGCG